MVLVLQLLLLFLPQQHILARTESLPPLTPFYKPPIGKADRRLEEPEVNAPLFSPREGKGKF